MKIARLGWEGKRIFAAMLRAIPLLSVLALLLSAPSQAALVSATPASLPPAASENASTAFLEGCSESRIGLLCHNDPVNHSDPTGLYVSGLTSWGGGDWIRGMNGLTNRDTDLINQARLTDFLNSVKPAARDAATASHSTNVEYGGALANTKKDPNDLARGQMTASTEDVARNPQGTHGLMNQTDFEKKPLPPGHERLIGGYWGLARWERGFPYGDRHALWTKHWSAVLGIPRPEGQHGQPDVRVFQYSPEMTEPRMDEP